VSIRFSAFPFSFKKEKDLVSSPSKFIGNEFYANNLIISFTAYTINFIGCKHIWKVQRTTIGRKRERDVDKQYNAKSIAFNF